MSAGFVWRDAGRTVVFRQDGLASAPAILAEHGFADFALLSTPRALLGAPELEAAASAVHAVPPGQVPAAAATLLERAGGERLVALGGGRAIDAAKAVAAVSGAAVAAIPTTLSGAEMTGFHRLPAGAEERARGLVRPRLALADPAAMTTLAEPALRASAMNALAHGADSLHTPFANPVSRMAALRGAELIATALDSPRAARDRGDLALGSILCGYAIDSARFGLHHVVCQSLVRVCGTPHAETNAAILPGALELLRERVDDGLAPLAEALGAPADQLAGRVAGLAGHREGLGALGAERERIEAALDAIEQRPELSFTPSPPGREELRGLIESAW